MNTFKKPTLEVITFASSDVITVSICPLDISIENGGQVGGGGDSGVDYGTPEY